MQMKVLIVEDDNTLAALQSMTLAGLGFWTEIISNGSLAISKMKEWKPDIVVLDLDLPGKNGVTIMQEMLYDADLKSTILIANTSHLKTDDNLGFAYFYQYERMKNQEPVMIDKSSLMSQNANDLRYAIAGLVSAKYGNVPEALADWLSKNPPQKNR